MVTTLKRTLPYAENNRIRYHRHFVDAVVAIFVAIVDLVQGL